MDSRVQRQDADKRRRNTQFFSRSQTEVREHVRKHVPAEEYWDLFADHHDEQVAQKRWLNEGKSHGSFVPGVLQLGEIVYVARYDCTKLYKGNSLVNIAC